MTVDDLLIRMLQDPDVAQEVEKHAEADALSLWLVQYRAAHGLSVEQLAARLPGISLDTIYDVEAGDLQPTLALLRLLSRRLGVPIELHVERGTSVDRIFVDAGAG